MTVLLPFTTALVNARKLQEHQGIVPQALGNLAVVEISKDIFHPATKDSLMHIFQRFLSILNALAVPVTLLAALSVRLVYSVRYRPGLGAGGTSRFRPDDSPARALASGATRTPPLSP